MTNLDLRFQAHGGPSAGSRLLRSLYAMVPACLAVSGAGAAPQSLLETQGQALIGPGTVLPAPGGPMLKNPGFGVWTAVRADDGRAFCTLLENFGGSLYSWSQGTGLVRLLGPESPIPSGTPLPTTVGVSEAISPGIRVSSNGRHVLFGTGLTGSSTTTSNDSALYVLSSGNPRLLVREGLPAPGTQGATVLSDLKQQFPEFNGLDENGLVSFRVRISGGDVSGSTNDELIYRGSPGNLTVVAREGDALPTGELLSELIPAQPQAIQRQVHRLGEQGTLLFDSRLLQGASPVPSTAANDQVVLLSRPGQALVALVREGDAAPFPGTSYGGLAGDWIRWLGRGPAFSAQDPGATFLTTLIGGSVSAGTLEALIQIRQSGATALARIGDPVANLTGVTLDEFENPTFVYGSSGRAAFLGGLGGPVSSGDDSAILAVSPGGALEVIAREGDIAPGTGGKRFGIPFQVLVMDSFDRIWFRANLEGGLLGSSTTWLHQPGLGLRPVGFVGDVLAAPSGQNIAASSLGLNIHYTTTGRPASVTADGVALVSMFGGASSSSAADKLAIVTVGTQSLSTSAPSLSVSSGGTIEVPIQTGSALAGLVYLTLGSFSGSSPGVPTDAGVLPLNPDFLTNAMLIGANQGPFQQNLGQLSDLGVGPARVSVPPGSSALAGLRATFAGLVIDVQGIPRVTFVTDAASVLFLP